MPSKNRCKSTILEQLLDRPNAFNFFQAVRLIEVAGQQSGNTFTEIGLDGVFSEPIQFNVWNSTCFPNSDIHSISPLASSYQREPHDFYPLQLRVALMGLTGVVGVLPQHYTELVIQNEMLNNTALQAFLDLFNHRIISLFYRSWKKNQFFIGYENAKKKSQQPDEFTEILYGLWGNGLQSTRNKYRIPDEAITFYSGLLQHNLCSAVGLKIILSDYFKLPVEIEQFHLEKLFLPQEDCTRISSQNFSGESFNTLGVNAVIGDYVWSVDNRFRIVIGPLTYKQFLTLLPTGDMLEPLYQWVSVYLGLEFIFDLQLRLKKSEVPDCQLRQKNPLQLGWNTWLKSENLEKKMDDVVLGVASSLAD